MTHVVPNDALTAEERRSVIAAAFPDSNFKCEYNFIYFFTMRRFSHHGDEKAIGTSESVRSGNASGNSCTSVAGRLYGCAYYRQKRDSAVPRGYVQQVVVLLSRLPYHVLHELILRIVVPRFSQCCPLSPDISPVLCSSTLAPQPTQFFHADTSFNKDHYTQEDILDRAMEEIRQWPPPHASMHYQLTLLYQVLDFITPSHIVRADLSLASSASGRGRRHSTSTRLRTVGAGDSRRSSATSNGRCPNPIPFAPASSCTHELSSVIPLYSLLHAHIAHLTKVWELLISHRSIFVMSDTASCAAGVAHAITSLVSPLRFNGKLFPHFTTKHDNLERFRRLGKEIPFDNNESIVVACTNRLLCRAFDAWHSWLIVLDAAFNQSGTTPQMQKASSLNRLGTENRELQQQNNKEKPSSPSPVVSAIHDRVGSLSFLITSPAVQDRGTTMPVTRLPYGSHLVPVSVVDDSTKGINSSPKCQKESHTSPSVVTPPRTACDDHLHKQYVICSASDDSEGGSTPPPLRQHQHGGASAWGSAGSSSLHTPREAHHADPSVVSVAVENAKEFHSGFTAEEWKFHLNAQTPAATTGLDTSRSELSKALSNYFDASFQFVLNHRELTHSLMQQLEKVSRMDKGEKEVTISMHLELLYDRPTTTSSPPAAAPQSGSAALKEFSASTIFSQQTVADETVRRFFRSLTVEFLRPMESWFTSELRDGGGSGSVLEWCDGRVFQSERLTGRRFMQYISTHHRSVVGTSIKGELSYKSYSAIYERFSQGALFNAYVAQLFDERLREEVKNFTAEKWSHVKGEEARLAIFFGLLRVALLEAENVLDTDVLFIGAVRGVLTTMANGFSQPIRDDLLHDLDNKWKF